MSRSGPARPVGSPVVGAASARPAHGAQMGVLLLRLRPWAVSREIWEVVCFLVFFFWARSFLLGFAVSVVVYVPSGSIPFW